MSPDNQLIVDQLRERFKKLIDVGEPEYYLGGNFERITDPESLLVLGSKSYIKRAKRCLEQYEKLAATQADGATRPI